MTKTKKLFITFFTVFLLTAVQAFAQQQITKFAVVDTSKVYSAYFKNSAPVRNYEAKKKELQAEITKRADEIKELKRKKAEYQKNGDTTKAQKLEADLNILKNTQMQRMQNLKQCLLTSNVLMTSIRNCTRLLQK